MGGPLETIKDQIDLFSFLAYLDYSFTVVHAKTICLLSNITYREIVKNKILLETEYYLFESYLFYTYRLNLYIVYKLFLSILI